ncbi:hypothetical protein FN846DRAFT_795989 [Sphaerosporella brunnea]|uniref:Translation initiation factor IF-2, mitochondrial n=1 Tax=Sphaerosporella brunnea TaxID=1250544 RepID=A0A5J5EYI8_9PEZI|nr:hypothetical protein FN846DRAFT_795989 [Sphaerosporella brunnea]
MLRTSKSAVNRPVFTCAIRPARTLPAVRRLHSSNKANGYDASTPPRPTNASSSSSSSSSYDPSTPNNSFQSPQRKPVLRAASKWNLPIDGPWGGGNVSNGNSNAQNAQNSNSSSPPPPPQPFRINIAGGNCKPSNITRPSNVAARRPADAGTNTRRPESLFSILGQKNKDDAPLPPFGVDPQRASNITRSSNIVQPSEMQRPSRRPEGQERHTPRFGGEDQRYGGDRSQRNDRFGAGRNERFGADRSDRQPRESWDQFGRERRQPRESWDQFGRGDRQPRESWDQFGRGDRQARHDRYGSDRYGREQPTRDIEPEAVGEPVAEEEPASSRFSTVQTRQKLEDSAYSKKQSAKNKDRAKRRFDDQESALLDGEEDTALSAKELRKAKKAAKRKEVKKELIPIFLPQFISVENLASVLNVRVERFTQHMQEMGFEETSYSHVLNAEEAGLIAGEYGYEPVIDRGEELDLKPRPQPEDKSLLPIRPPVVTIMGHVDHGKTTLLDWLRKSSVAASEHGGITQHIGAFSVTMPSGKVITFLDTPGHAAFLSMRERGANVTDIVILVVAADDSVKPQTLEAIQHAKAANVPMIVAINKMDKENADPERVKQDLARYGVEVEDIGGDTQTVCVSGKTGMGMEELEEATLTLGEILDHRAETDGQVEGWVLEAQTKKKGRVATVLVTRGTLKPGGIVVAGRTWAKVRTMTNEHGEDIFSAGPGTPVEIDGWRDHPEAGELAISAETEDRAKQAVDYRVEKAERIKQTLDMEAINEARRTAREKEEAEEEVRRQAELNGEDPDKAVAEDAKRLKESVVVKQKEVLLIVKADVSGSVEAVVDSVVVLGNDEVKARVLRGSFGAVSEFDIDHAAAAGAYIISFNLPPDPQIYQYARARKVEIISNNVIYRLVEEVKAKLSDLLPPKISHNVTGEAEIAMIFNINIKGKVFKPVAGCRVKSGSVTRNAKVRVLRKDEIVFDGMLESLKNVKSNVLVMNKGSDCGMSFEGWGEFKEGDVVQCYEVFEEKRSL